MQEMITEEAFKPDHAGVQAYLNQIQKRRSVRKLTRGPVTDETIHTILEAGRWSPSSSNSQPARIILLKERHEAFWDFIEQTLRRKLQGDQLTRALNRLPGYRSGIFSLVFYEDTTITNNTPPGMKPENWKSFTTQAMGIIQINVWNAIAAANLATSNQHINLQMEEELRDFLNVPSTWTSYSIFPVGYMAETLSEGKRHDYEKVIFHEQGPAV